MKDLSDPKKSVIKLTRRQTQIVQMLVEYDCNIQDIAEMLHISLITAYQHLGVARQKTGCITTTGLVIYCLKRGIVRLFPPPERRYLTARKNDNDIHI